MADDNNLNINIGVNPAKAESGSKRASTAVSGVSKEARELDKAFRALKSAIDPTFAATEKYNRSLEQAQKLLKAGMITRKEYNAAIKLSKAALDEEVGAILRNSTAGQKAAAAAVAASKAQAAQAKETSRQEQQAAREAAQAKIKAAQDARRAQQLAEQQEQRAISLAARLARQAAVEAQRSVRSAGSTQRGVAPGSISTDRSVKQLQYDYERAYAAAGRAAQKAADMAAKAAEAGNARSAAAAQAAAEKAKAAAEDASARAITLARAKASAEGEASAQAAAADKAARASEKQAARDAAQAAKQAARDKEKADKDAVRAAREAASATEAQAQAERRAAATLSEMRSSIDPVYAAQNRYNQTLRTATQLLMDNKLKEGEWIAIQKQAKTQMDINVRSMGRMNNMNVQIGYQMQDVVASFAAGINPLVILAEQGGQTASALSQMGGAGGRVAAFFAGPWGAAIFGAITLVGFLWGSLRKSKDATLDLMDANSRSIHTYQELTKALHDYVKELKDANTNELEALRIKQDANAAMNAERIKDYQQTTAKIAQLEKQIQNVTDHNDGGPAAGGALIGLEIQLMLAKRHLAELGDTAKDIQEAVTQTAISSAQMEAKAIADPKVALEQAEQRYETQIQTAYAKEITAIQENKSFTTAQKALAVEILRLRMAQQLGAAKKKLAEDQAALKDTGGNKTRETGEFMMPVSGYRMGSPFHEANHMGHTHQGVDLQVAAGTAVRAAFDGYVKLAKVVGDYGNLIEISHGAGTESRYAHLSQFAVSPGQQVRKGDIIGYSGGVRGAPGSGNSTGPHLHYEVRVNGKPVDPTKKNIFPVDGIKAATEGMKEFETAAQKAARETAEGIKLAEDEVAKDSTLTMDQKLEKIAAFEAQRVKVIQDGYGKESKEAKAAQREALDALDRYHQQILQRESQRLKQEQVIAEGHKRVMQEAENFGADQRMQNVDFLQGAGMLNEKQALVMKAQILDEQYQMERAHAEQIYQMKIEYMEKEKSLPGQTADQIANIQAEERQTTQAHYDELARIQMTYAGKIADVNRQAASHSLQRWQDMTQTFTSGLNSAFQGLWTHSISMQQALLNIADQMVYKVADIALQGAQEQLMIWLGLKQKKQVLDATEMATSRAHEAARTAMTAASVGKQTAITVAGATHQAAAEQIVVGAKVAGETAKTAAAVSGATTQKSISAAAGTAEISNQAAQSAAGAYKSTVVIPFIGPVSAPIAAALALATVLGFASLIHAEGGQAEVPYDGQLSMLHKKEMVLPAWAAEPLRQGLRTGKSSSPIFGGAATQGENVRNSTFNNGGDTIFNYQPQHNNQMMDMDSLLRRDGATLRKWLKNEHRNGTLKGFK